MLERTSAFFKKKKQEMYINGLQVERKRKEKKKVMTIKKVIKMRILYVGKSNHTRKDKVLFGK